MERLFIVPNVRLKESPHKNNAPTVGAVRTLQSKYHSFTTNENIRLSLLYHKSETDATESEDFVKENFTMTTNIPEMLGVKEIAERYRISQNYARNLALSGAVKAVRVGKGKILINAESMADFFNSSYINTQKPATNGDIKPISIEDFTDSFGE